MNLLQNQLTNMDVTEGVSSLSIVFLSNSHFCVYFLLMTKQCLQALPIYASRFIHPSHPTVGVSINKHHLNCLKLQTNLSFTIHLIQCMHKRVFLVSGLQWIMIPGVLFFVFLVVKPPMVCFANMSNYRYLRKPQVFLWFIQPTYLSQKSSINPHIMLEIPLFFVVRIQCLRVKLPWLITKLCSQTEIIMFDG